MAKMTLSKALKERDKAIENAKIKLVQQETKQIKEGKKKVSMSKK